MKVGLIGYGKMGKAIETILIERGHEVALKISHTPSLEEVKGLDVAIEFSRPEYAFENLNVLLKSGIPTICGTTGWLNQLEEIEEITKSNQAAFLYASNFSLGVNLFFELNKQLAKMMNRYRNEYNVHL